MSTRIYQGFRLATDSLAEAMRIVEAFRPWVTEQSEKLFDTFMENMAKNGDNAIKAYDTWQDLRAEVRKEQRRIPHVDTDFNVVLIPAGGAMLGIVYTEHPDWYTAWCAHEGVEEFGFWDNADGPDGMLEEQWEARKQAWSVLTNAPVSMQGFSIELVSPHGPLPKAWRDLKD
ncbi:hypothetical protein [Burkholderia ubonensis]|uniref:hypothetical protein n=1 Tax=Burkholderia ubonensis TaxID=101571 RepID=UPI000754DACB|nr:hypothetical protein [Burkholderia ubonensis]KVP17024.1 hypothetical protein WJ84_01750 [Burkholderia ubonensis]KVP39850.1 hypothetical protein WJ87_06615 [Burkholderia ubonensis]